MVRGIAFAIHVQPKASRAAAAGLPQLVSTDLVYSAYAALHSSLQWRVRTLGFLELSPYEPCARVFT